MARQAASSKSKKEVGRLPNERWSDKRKIRTLLAKLQALKYWPGVRMREVRAAAEGLGFSLGPSKEDVYKEVKKAVDVANLKLTREKNRRKAEQVAAAKIAAAECSEGEEPLAKALAVETTRVKQAEQDRSDLQEQCKAYEAEIIALKVRLSAAEEKTEKYEKFIREFKQESTDVLQEEEKKSAVIDWHANLDTWIALQKRENKAHNTIKSFESTLIPWVEWLIKNGSRPTDQLLLEYLETQLKLTKRGSYWKVGKTIKLFTNRFLVNRKIELTPPVGFTKEKPTLAMPRPMLDALTAHVVAKARSYEPKGKNCKDPNAPQNLAKYLGK